MWCSTISYFWIVPTAGTLPLRAATAYLILGELSSSVNTVRIVLAVKRHGLFAVSVPAAERIYKQRNNFMHTIKNMFTPKKPQQKKEQVMMVMVLLVAINSFCIMVAVFH